MCLNLYFNRRVGRMPWKNVMIVFIFIHSIHCCRNGYQKHDEGGSRQSTPPVLFRSWTCPLKQVWLRFYLVKCDISLSLCCVIKRQCFTATCMEKCLRGVCWVYFTVVCWYKVLLVTQKYWGGWCTFSTKWVRLFQEVLSVLDFISHCGLTVITATRSSVAINRMW